jgi:hypothetical protein
LPLHPPLGLRRALDGPIRRSHPPLTVQSIPSLAGSRLATFPASVVTGRLPVSQATGFPHCLAIRRLRGAGLW